MPVDVKCNYCLTYGPVSQFRFLSCGHCSCSSCAKQIMTLVNPRCPTCRAPIGPHNTFFKLYATFSESTADKVERIIDGLDKIDETVPIQSLKKAGPQALKASHYITHGDFGDAERAQMQERLLEAIERLEVRVESTSELIEKRQKEDANRARSLEHLRSLSDMEVAEEQNWDMALQMERRNQPEPDKGKNSISTSFLEEQNVRLSSQLQEYQKRITGLELLLKKKESELHKQAQLYRHKLKGVRQQKKPSRASSSADDSLVVTET